MPTSHPGVCATATVSRRRLLPALAAACAAALAFLSAPAAHAMGGTEVTFDESAITRIVYVNTATGTDGGNFSGTSSSPAQTITRGLLIAADHENATGESTKVLIAPGLYRETINMRTAAHAHTVIVIEGDASLPGQVVVTGAEHFTGWVHQGNNVWSRAWPYNFTYTPITENDGVGNFTYPEASTRKEHVVVDNTLYVQRLSLAALDTESFYVDSAAATIHLKVPAGVDPNTRATEVVARDWCAYLYKPGANAHIPDNLVFRNLTFRAASRDTLGGLLMLQNANRIRVENCRFEQAKEFGLHIMNSSDITVVNSVATNNGMMGLAIDGHNLVVRNFTASFNSALAARAGLNGWAPAGIKGGDIAHSSFVDVTVEDNAQLGLWIDTRSHNVLVQNLISRRNLGQGFFWELNHGQSSRTFPIANLGTQTTLLLRNSLIENNGRIGLRIAESDNVVLDNVTLRGNADGQLGFTRNADRADLGPVTIKNSRLESTAASQPLFAYPGGSDPSWAQFLAGLTADSHGNTYVHPDAALAFRNHRGLPHLNLPGWQNLTGLEVASVFTGPGALAPLALVPGQPSANFGNPLSGTLAYANDDGDWLRYDAVEIANFHAFTVRVANGHAAAGTDIGQSIELRLDSPTGPLIGTLPLTTTGGWSTYEVQSATLLPAAGGTHDLYVVMKGGSGVGNFTAFTLDRYVPAAADVILPGSVNDGLFGNGIGGNIIHSNDTGDYVRFDHITFASPEAVLRVDVAQGTALGQPTGRWVELRLGSPTGALVGQLDVLGTGSWSTYQIQEIALTNLPLGTHTIYFVMQGGSGVGNFGRFDLIFTPPAPPAPAGPVLVALYNGVAATGDWLGDSTIVTGSSLGNGSTSSAIDVSGVTDPAPEAVYKTHRHGTQFDYTLTGLQPGVSHTVRLHFCETWATGSNKRRFHVDINGVRVLTNLDVFQVTGGQFRAHAETFTATADANGVIVVSFLTGSKNRPFVSGLELWR